MYIDTTNDSSGRICLNAAVADSAYKLISSSTNNALGVGSATVPTYFAGGIPTACSSLSLSTSGNAATATKLAEAVKINLTGSVTGSTSFDGSGDVSINTTTNHNHDDRYLKLTGGNLTGTVNSTGNINLNGSNAYFSLGITPSGSRCYFQTYNAVTNGTDNNDLKAGFGFGWAKSLTIDKSGNVNIVGDLVVSGGDITGNASSATKATQDGAGNVITSKYVTLDTAQTVSGTKTMTGGLNVSGRCAGGGDDEGIVVGFANNGYAGLCLGGASTARSVFYFKSDGTKPFWRYNDSSNSYDISHPAKSGTIALTSDLGDYVKKSGDTMSGQLTAPGIAYVQNGVTSTISSINNTWLHYQTNSPSGHWFNKNVSVQGNIYAGTNYSDLVLTSANYADYAAKKDGTNTSGTWPISISGNAATATTASLAAKLNANNAKSNKATRFSSGLPVECDNLLDHSVSGNAGTATLLQLHNTVTNTSTRSIAASGWNGAVSGVNYVWGQSFKDTSIGNDTGDLVLALRAGQYVSGGTELCMMIDGDYYSMGNKVLHAGNYSSYASPASYWSWSGQSGQPTWLWGGNEFGQYKVWNPSNFNVNSAKSSTSSSYLSINNSANLSSCLQYVQVSAQTSGNDLPTNTWWHVIKMNHGQGDTYYKRLLAFDFWNDNIMTSGAAGDGVTRSWKQVWVQGNAVTGAVWNDYAECRESDCPEAGYVLAENGNDSLSKTTERLSSFAGVSSDTWGFSQGETEKAKTHIAVAGRVLVYPYQNRNNYKPGDCVCAAPGGTVDIMTREEIINWPDRIVGTVSCVPEYEEWGGGEIADRDPVKVNGRIWIKVV